MPRELVIPDRGTVTLREYDEPALAPGEVRVESAFTACKHGTMLRKFRGDEDNWHSAFEREHRISRPERSLPAYPRHVGNVTVGVVTEVGVDVSEFAPGDRVFGHLPVRETHAVPAAELRHAPPEMDAEAIVFRDPGGVGVHLVRGSDLRLGEAVAVFGAGAIGQMAAQFARVAGARTVVVSDPIDRRRAAARDHGADLVVDPTEEDAAMRIKTAVTTGEEPGVDRALETSAAYAGLGDAVRAVAVEGTVASCAYYEGDAGTLDLGAEFHRNGVEIRSVQPGSSETMAFHPRWTRETLRDEAFRHLQAGRVGVEGLVDPVVSLADAADAVRRVESHPEESLKLGVTYG